MKYRVILTCEHATNAMPKSFQSLFSQTFLNSHRGIDKGAKALFMYLAKHLKCYAKAATMSRLLIDLNRSLDNPQLFHSAVMKLGEKIPEKIIQRYYLPYRSEIENHIQAILTQGEGVIHLSIHSFTPILRGVKRETDIGLLFDPKRSGERDFCQNLRRHLQRQITNTIHFNSPYQGTSDGFTTHLRQTLPPEHYLGIEIEMNQRLVKQTPRNQLRLFQAIAESVAVGLAKIQA
ncbi:MAG: N-formylglutamate amidohydrolase [Legionellales bacterium]|nr:N-formylglutamate amidohydrolase [Legionellales bacterium]